jgi:hypothetical protein
MSATTFALMVMVGTTPPYSAGTFRSYSACVAAAHGAVESLQPIEHRDVRWECVPERDHQ